MSTQLQAELLASEPVVFKNALKDCRTVLPNGKVVHFRDYIYATKLVSDIHMLNQMVAEGGFVSHGNAEDLTNKPVEGTNFVEELKDKLRQELMKEMALAQAEQTAQAEKSANDGSSAGPTAGAHTLNPVNTAAFAAQAAAASTSASASAPASAPAKK